MDDICGNLIIPINGTVSIPWSELAKGGIHQFPGDPRSYLRSDEQSLLPWIYTVIILVVHIPTVIIRVVKWETVQTWCLACTFLTVVVYVQAYFLRGSRPRLSSFGHRCCCLLTPTVWHRSFSSSVTNTICCSVPGVCGFG
jgi:hypothetical protein